MKKIGIVGVGAIAQAHIKALEDASFGKVVAIADIRPEAAKAAAEAVGAKGFTSHEDMLKSEALDGVVICTPPNTHPEIARAFLARSIPVLCEKPVAIDIAGAEAMLAAGRQSKTLVTMASKFRYVEDVIKLRSIIASGLLGEILLLENAFVSPADMSKRWNSQPAVSGGGVLIDNGTHSVDIIAYLLGPIREVLAVTSTFSPDLQVDDNVTLVAKTASGAMAKVDLSWTFDKQQPNFISVYGTQGTAHIGWRGSKYKQKSSSDWIEFGPGYDKVAAFRNNLANFCAAIDRSEPPLITMADAIASVYVIKAAYESAQTNGWVRVGTSNVSGLEVVAAKA
ncbi:MAG: Gfo/Idh/MocA family oxidoreductase [Hyphomicrobiaceae bacterium]|nr:Gfo/Idh/MocA family oxidoreductase [Hyphomicrobiaceae bacterium]